MDAGNSSFPRRRESTGLCRVDACQNQDLQDCGDLQDCDDALHRFMDAGPGGV